MPPVRALGTQGDESQLSTVHVTLATPIKVLRLDAENELAVAV
jgi:hypothetical protein